MRIEPRDRMTKLGTADAEVDGGRAKSVVVPDGERWRAALVYQGKEVLVAWFRDEGHARSVAERWLRDARAI